MNTDQRQQHLTQFYRLLASLEQNPGGARKLSDCSGRMDWPRAWRLFFPGVRRVPRRYGRLPARRAGWNPCPEGGRRHDALVTPFSAQRGGALRRRQPSWLDLSIDCRHGLDQKGRSSLSVLGARQFHTPSSQRGRAALRKSRHYRARQNVVALALH